MSFENNNTKQIFGFDDLYIVDDNGNRWGGWTTRPYLIRK
ncbi:hypothetical protein [Chengkuizengella axinellae]